MNSNFNDEQIRAYAAAFEEGDAIWCDGKWWKASKLTKFSQSLTCEAPNQYVIRCYDGEVAISGFREEEKPYRVTTLEHCELQGGEKLVWLGGELTMAYTTFGKTYKVISDHRGKVYYRDDKDNLREAGNKGWAVIPRYEQVKCSVKPKFKVGDIVNLKGYDIPLTIRSVNATKEVPEAYTYVVKFDSGNISTYWESDLELAEESSKTTLTEKVNEVVNVKMNEQSTEVNFNEVAIHSEIITRLVKQTIKGVKKYGDPVQHNNLSAVEWIDHAIDESIDQIVYLTALKQSLMSKGDEK